MSQLGDLDKILLEGLALSEAQLINMAFNLSEDQGKVHLSNAIDSFKDIYLKDTSSEVIFSLSTEYRFFIMELLKNINVVHRDIAVKDVLVPTIGDVTDNDLFVMFRNSHVEDSIL